MGKRLTTGERIRRYMEANPNAKPRQIAAELGVSARYVHSLRSSDKKKIAEGKPIRRVKRTYTKRTERLWQPPSVLPVPEPQVPAADPVSEAKSTMVHIGTFTSSKPILKEGFIDKRLKAHDNVNHPAHYKVGGIETIEFIEAKKLGYNLGNVIKYITRADHKGNVYEDLCKARWYLNREISKYLGVNNQ